eukprot:TRINITY_DN55186_c0_g1_i1.p1 TRINITY_DN55186_c0_g1~~TRINITY_DN55186_c0_g1_i1.p1  ORF type:complete len:440 (+),score=168.81 TRINITY_DN55186_c0_g1_i1:94-1320(+)
MSDLVLTSVPLKSTAALDFEKKLAVTGRLKSVDKGMLKLLTTGRAQLALRLEQAAKGGPEAAAAVQQTAAEYLALLAGAMPSLEELEGGAAPPAEGTEAGEGAEGHAAAATQQQQPVLRNMCYFFWTQSFGPRTSFAQDDTLYEAASILSNLAILDLRVAEQRVCNANRMNVDKEEKEAYRLCRAAAGKFSTAQKLMIKVADSPAMPMDIRAEVLEGLKNLALGQAQELGLAVAARKDENRGREMLAKLAAQARTLYADATVTMQPGAGARDQVFEQLAAYVGTKRRLMAARTVTYYALFLCKENRMPEALRCADQAVEEAAGAKAQAGKGPLSKFATAVEEQARGAQAKIRRDNELCSFQKPQDAPVEMPAGQLLARPDVQWGPHGGALPPPDARWTEQVRSAFQAQ